MNVKEMVHELIMALMLGVAGFGVSQIQSVNTSIGELNTKMSVMIERVAFQTQSIHDHEERLRRLEKK